MNIIPAQLYQKIPHKAAECSNWENLCGSSKSLAIAYAAMNLQQPLIVITKEVQTNITLEQELKFFISPAQNCPILTFPDWETLPYDNFSPHQDIISERLATLHQLPKIKNGIVIAAISTLMHHLPPREYIRKHSFILNKSEKIDITELRHNLGEYGYRCVNKVMEHGEFAIRGSIIDVFPNGAKNPYRIDLFDNEIDSIREFDVDTQRSGNKIEVINLLPAKEFPLTAESIANARKRWRTTFIDSPLDCPIYQSISNGESAPGIEYYLPLFFEHTASFTDYLPQNSLIITIDDIHANANAFWQKINERYSELQHNRIRPLLQPKTVFHTVDEIFHNIKQFPQIHISDNQRTSTTQNANILLSTSPLSDVALDSKAGQPLAKLATFLHETQHRVLFCAESLGRKEHILELLTTISVFPAPYNSWSEFINDDAQIGITIGQIETGFILHDTPNIALITETQLFGYQVVMQRRRRKTSKQHDPAAIINDLTELNIGAPIVHIEHGIGRYLGLQTLQTGDVITEFLTLEYANDTKLYIPVAAMHLVSRYTGVDQDSVILSNLGSKQWEKTKRKAAEKIRDVAAELLALYATRAAKPGTPCKFDAPDYQKFIAGFPFETTPDQEQAIISVIDDMTSTKCMDRLICGDVGFGKTEVAMRAAFIAVHNSKQVVVLAPTTILAQQHCNTFRDRFANWPFRVAIISRFSSAKEQQNVIEELAAGKIDIIIGTHKLLQPTIKFKNLGLIIIDEEHRFGVKQKERLKELRPNTDVLTLTATPIPRTLNMAFSGIRDFSIIATPPARRLSIKTFLHERDNALMREAILREVLRGGQVYFLHNYVDTIEKTAAELQKLIPTLKIAIAHGQMREHQLEHVMRDFYHQRFNVLVCTTIIESGIDVPTANTIVVDNADRFGLAQLHQLRGRVGRSHHQAYAYLLIKSHKTLTQDAKKRLEAITSMEDLGAGFSLATHDLEIRGAGELLGEEQSGQIQGIGFSLYMEYLERAIDALKNGTEPNLDEPPFNITEIDLQIPVLLPEIYLDDVSTRLTFYKRIANAQNKSELESLQEELIDRYGLLPDATKNLFKITELRLLAEKLGVHKITAGKQSGIIEFNDHPNIDAGKIIKLVQSNPALYKIKGSSKLEFRVVAESTAIAKIQALEDLLQKIILTR